MNPLPSHRLSEVARLFLRLGISAFGGPAAHIAMMHDETVKRCKWLSDEGFLDLVGAADVDESADRNREHDEGKRLHVRAHDHGKQCLKNPRQNTVGNLARPVSV